MVRAGSYSVIQDFGFTKDESPDRVDIDPYWIVSVVRLGTPLSFSRQKNSSVTKDLTRDTVTRSKSPLIITDDITQIQVQGSKQSHKKTCSFFMKGTGLEVNYLVEILPGDWVFAWIMNNRQDYDDTLALLEKGAQANHFTSGLKFVGRIDSVRKSIDVDPESGTVTSGYSVSCVGFDELDTSFFYDGLLATQDATEEVIGLWLARLGEDITAWFGETVVNGITLNNINIIVPTLIDLIIGRGPKSRRTGSTTPTVEAPDGTQLGAEPQFQHTAPFAYVMPEMAAAILGVNAESKTSGIVAYADILELVIGVQDYQKQNDWNVFIPELKNSTPRRRVTTNQLLGTYVPAFPNFTNKKLWDVLDQWLNPEINERYTCLRVNPAGHIMPTIIFRQIPFTTDAFIQASPTEEKAGDILGIDVEGPLRPTVPSSSNWLPVTRFLSLPQWDIAPVLIRHLDVGRSNATRTNYVHIYGSTSLLSDGIPLPYQMLQNPPTRDDLDIMKSGLRPHVNMVDCWVGDQIGATAGSWIRLVTDWTMGSQLTLNGSVTTVGIQSPICEGDNITLGDGCVYHIQSVNHSASINGMTGKKTWTTSMTLVNGMRQVGLNADDENSVSTRGTHPIYPGFDITDNTVYDPGITNEQGRHTSGGLSHRTPHFDPIQAVPLAPMFGPLEPDGDVEAMFAAPKRLGNSKKK